MFLGSRSRHSSTTVCTSLSGERRHRKKKSPLVAVQLGRLAQIDGVGVADDGGLLRLAEHLGQETVGTTVLRSRSPSTLPAPTEGELIRVAHQHQPAAGTQRFQQRLHQLQVHHAHLVHDDGVGLQRVAAVLFK